MYKCICILLILISFGCASPYKDIDEAQPNTEYSVFGCASSMSLYGEAQPNDIRISNIHIHLYMPIVFITDLLPCIVSV